MVPEVGLEPTQGKTLADFESAASAIPPLRLRLAGSLSIVAGLDPRCIIPIQGTMQRLSMGAAAAALAPTKVSPALARLPFPRPSPRQPSPGIEKRRGNEGNSAETITELPGRSFGNSRIPIRRRRWHTDCSPIPMTNAPSGTLSLSARVQREVKCPKCHSARVHYSATKSVVDEVLNLIGRRPLRCHSCYFRWRKWIAAKEGLV